MVSLIIWKGVAAGCCVSEIATAGWIGRSAGCISSSRKEK
jgi:hypothetical protein